MYGTDKKAAEEVADQHLDVRHDQALPRFARLLRLLHRRGRSSGSRSSRRGLRGRLFGFLGLRLRTHDMSVETQTHTWKTSVAEAVGRIRYGEGNAFCFFLRENTTKHTDNSSRFGCSSAWQTGFGGRAARAVMARVRLASWAAAFGDWFSRAIGSACTSGCQAPVCMRPSSSAAEASAFSGYHAFRAPYASPRSPHRACL